jgi:hypothetical protein
MPTIALKLTQQTIHLIAEASDTSPYVIDNVYQNFCNLEQVGYVVLDHVCEHGDLQPPLVMQERVFNKDFMFVTAPSDTEFTEVIKI